MRKYRWLNDGEKAEMILFQKSVPRVVSRRKVVKALHAFRIILSVVHALKKRRKIKKQTA